MHPGIGRTLRLSALTRRTLIGGGKPSPLVTRSLASHSSEQNNKDNPGSKKWIIGGAGGLGLGSTIAAYVYLSSEDESSKAPQVPIPDLPSGVDYLLIGAGTASFSAFRSIKANDVRSKILLVGSEDQIPYMRPPLSKEMFYNSDPNLKDAMKFEQWNGRQRSLYYEPEAFYMPLEKLEGSAKGGISVLKNTWVSAIDSEKRIAHLKDKEGRIGSIEYGNCLLATGSKPKTLPELQGLPSSFYSTFKSFNDFNRLDSRIQKGKISSVAIIGGGFLGTELSVAFGARSKIIDPNFSVTQVFPEEGNMGRILPKYLSQWMTQKVKNEGVNVEVGCTLSSAHLERGKVILTLSNGREIKVDHVIMSVGSEPNIQLAESAKLETAQGGFKVNSEFKAKPHIWAAGDVASFEDPLLGRRRIEHHDHAVTSGRIAGENMSGGSLEFSKQSMFWSDLGPDIGFEAVGLIDSELSTHCVFLSKDTEGSKDDFDRGVVFYLKDDIIVGVLLWNIFDQIALARRVIREKRKFEDITEVAKLFRLVDTRLEAKETNETSKSNETEPSKPSEEEAHKPTEEEPSNLVVEEVSKPTEKEPSKPIVEEVSKPTEEEQSKPIAEDASKPTQEQSAKPLEELPTKPVEAPSDKSLEEQSSAPLKEESQSPLVSTEPTTEESKAME